MVAAGGVLSQRVSGEFREAVTKWEGKVGVDGKGLDRAGWGNLTFARNGIGIEGV